MQRSLILIKPDAMERGLGGAIIDRLQQLGLKLLALKTLHMDEALARRHYAIHEGKPFFNDLLAYITSTPIIASVFLRRLRLGIPLEADPTVQYALANEPANVARYGYWKQNLTTQDLEVDSLYNTYRNVGLPPGPICNPGLASIEAVIRPEQTNYLYFVAKPDGTHAFAETLEEHQSNIEEYQR